MQAYRSTALLFAASLLCLPAVRAQQKAFATPPTYTAPAAVPAPGSLNWVPGGLAAVAEQASTRTEFTLDRTTLSLVSNLSTLDAPTRNAIARLNGVAVHLYHFPASGSYNSANLQAMREELDLPGWKHLVSEASHAGTDGKPAGRTDVWLTTSGMNVTGAVILLATSSTLDLINVSGDISTLDLLHLRGHFGIPQFSENAPSH